MFTWEKIKPNEEPWFKCLYEQLQGVKKKTAPPSFKFSDYIFALIASI